MHQWYLCKKNELSGPFSFYDLKQAFDEGRLSEEDWLKPHTSTKWKPAYEWSEWEDYFKDLKFKPIVQRDWIVLKWSSDYNSYLQYGPFHQVEVLTKIYEGLFEYNDFIWKAGYTEWLRIGSVEDFIPQSAKFDFVEGAKEDYGQNRTNQESFNINSVDLLTNQNLKNTFYEVIPSEAVETKRADNLNIEQKQGNLSNMKTKRRDLIPNYYKPVKNKRKRWWLFSFFCFALTIFIAFWGKSSLILYL